MSPRRFAVMAFVLGCAGCGAGVHTRAGGGVGALSVHEVAWNPTQAPIGHVQAVADAAGVTVVFADTGATILASGAVLAVDHARTDWVDAAVIPSAGKSPKIVGLSADGRLFELKDRNRFEDVSARYGMETQTVRGVAALGNGLLGFLLQQQIAVADGSNVSRYDSPSYIALLGGGGSGLALDSAGAFLFDPARRLAQRYALAGIRHGALGSDGRLYASTARAIYAAAAPSGDLSLIYDSRASGIGALVASRDTVWFTDGRELGIVVKNRILETSTAPAGVAAKLASSANGDVWAISAGGLRRFSRVASSADRTALWASSIAPIFARVCADCHEPNGVSGVDLSTLDAWESERGELRQRVLEARTMPPQGHELAEAERAAIAAWLRDGL